MKKSDYLDSREVAEMIGKQHRHLIRDIRNYVDQLGQTKVGQSDFFKESSYQNKQNKTMPCYLVSKKGCEFIANKLTGVKGTEFTAKYINRFHDMEDTIQSGLPKMSKELQAIIMIDQRTVEIDKRLDRLEFDVPLYGSESDEMQKHVKRKVVQILGGKNSNAYNDSSVRSKVFRDAYAQLKREFGVSMNSYKAILRKYLDQAHEFIDAYEPPVYLNELITDTNNQSGFYPKG